MRADRGRYGGKSSRCDRGEVRESSALLMFRYILGKEIKMGQSQNDVALGRFLSLVLRHNPSAAFLTLDPHGWADVDDLIAGCCRAGKSIDRETLERIVRENEKKRYSFNEDHTKIRANQGHSIQVDLEFVSQTPPDRLYHGTASRFLDSIRREGITRQSRQYVHLSRDEATAQQVGSRHGNPVVLTIDAARMHDDGYEFFLAQNGVWLCHEVPWRYVLGQKTED